MNGTGIAKRTSTIRKIGWLTVGSMLALALLAPGANAATGNNSGTNVQWDQPIQLCTGGPDGDIIPVPGMAAWVFIHNQVSGPGILSANFLAAGDVTANSYNQGNTVRYIVWTGFDTLHTYSDNIDGGILTLSHVCAGTTTTTTSTSTSTTSTSTTSTTTSSSTTSSTTTAAPSQAVLSETSDPSVTLPPTDTFAGEASAAQPSGSAMRLILIAMAGILSAVMVLTPAKVGNRR